MNINQSMNIINNMNIMNINYTINEYNQSMNINEGN